MYYYVTLSQNKEYTASEQRVLEGGGSGVGVRV